MIGPNSMTFKRLLQTHENLNQKLEQWQYVSLITSKQQTLDFIFNDKILAINFLLAVQLCMPNKDSTVKILNPTLLSIHMTKLKIYKIASLKKISVAKLLMLALIKTAV